MCWYSLTIPGGIVGNVCPGGLVFFRRAVTHQQQRMLAIHVILNYAGHVQIKYWCLVFILKVHFMCLIKITTFLLTISLLPLRIFASVCCSSCVSDRYMPVIVLFSLCKLSRKTFWFTAYNNFYVLCGHVSVIK